MTRVSLYASLLVLVMLTGSCIITPVRGSNLFENQPKFTVLSLTTPKVKTSMKTISRRGFWKQVKHYSIEVEVSGYTELAGWKAYSAVLGARIVMQTTSERLINKRKVNVRAVQYVTPLFMKDGGSDMSYTLNIQIDDLPEEMVEGVEFRVGTPATLEENRISKRFKAFGPIKDQ